MLILTPTRELAHQINTVLGPLAKTMHLQAACVYGGVGMEPQTRALRRGTDIIIATPGRLMDHIRQGNARFDALSILVFDEADRMMDMGFLPDMKRIVSELPRERQTLMFSATFAPEIRTLATQFQQDAVHIEVAAQSTAAEAVRQSIYTVVHSGKPGLLSKVLREPAVDSAIVFVRTKHGADRVAKKLADDGIRAQAIHGGRSQSQRQKALDGFRRGQHTVLVATDVAARGIDIRGVTHVVNYDVPNTYDDYVHRIGRTARANAEGDAWTFICPDEHEELGMLERGLGRSIDQIMWEGAVPVVVRSSNGRGRAPFKKGNNRGGSQRGPANHRSADAPRGGRQNGRNDRNERSDRGERSDNADRPRSERGHQSDTNRDRQPARARGPVKSDGRERTESNGTPREGGNRGSNRRQGGFRGRRNTEKGGSRSTAGARE
jgi:ATP-dependent RNA helicase RhlE